MPQLFWGRWEDYEKEAFEGQEFAKIGSRLYSEHAVMRFLPSGKRGVSITQKKKSDPITKSSWEGYSDDESRSIPPSFIEEAILHGEKHLYEKDPKITNYLYGELVVGTKENGRIVITVIYSHSKK